MELLVHFNTLPEGKSLDDVHGELTVVLENDGFFLGIGEDYLDIELEDEKANPKYGILTVKNYLQKANFAPDTTIELAGVAVGIFE